jgi:hypothetical protein
MHHRTVLGLSVLLACSSMGCSSKDAQGSGVGEGFNGSGGTPEDASGGLVFGTGGTSGSAGGGGSAGSTAGTGGGGTGSTFTEFGDACAAQAQRAEGIPVDMYVMWDKSASMNQPVGTNDTRWTVLVRAFRSFINDPESAGIGVGIRIRRRRPPPPFKGRSITPAHGRPRTRITP